jgi:Tfp pilus assembly protein PilF
VPTSPRRNRLIVLAVIVLTLAVASVGANWIRQRMLDSRAVAARESGRAALVAGDYLGALDGIGRYLQRFGGRGASTEDYVAYARARRNIPLPNRRHLLQAMETLRHALDVDPNCVEARSELLDLYLSTGYQTEALELVDSWLAKTPRDAALLRRKRDLLVGLRKFDKALETADAVNEVAPDDLDGFLRTLRIRVETQKPTSETDAWVDRALASHRDDPRFELLRVAALVGRTTTPDVSKQIDEILDRLIAGGGAATDPSFATLLAAQLDTAGRFDDSLRVLTAAAGADDPELRRELARRLWYARRVDEIPPQVAKWGDDACRKDPELAALNALALVVTGRAADAAPLRSLLAEKADDVGKGWSAFVEASLRESRPDLGVVKSLAEAVAASPRSAILHQALGDAHAALGETELAVRDWDAAAKRTAIWSRPLVSMARANVATPGRERLAEEQARAALARSPHDVEVMRAAVETVAIAGGEIDAKQIDVVLRTLDFLRQSAPEHSTDLIPVQVELLRRRDPKQAESLIVAALDAKSTCSEDTLLRLARIAASAGMPLEFEVLDRCETAHGATPQLALAKAVAMSRHGDYAAGLAAFDALRKRAPADAPLFDWDLARTRYVDAAGRPEAGAAWLTLAEVHPTELAAQLGALGSSGAWTDRESIARAIDRVKEMTGDEGTTWRVARARWILSGDSATESDVADAVTQLKGVVAVAPYSAAAHRLLASALERLGNVAAAEQELRLADSASPGMISVALELARLAQKQGNGEEARRQLDKAVAAKDLSPEQAERAAYLLAVQGDARAGADVLEPLTSRMRLSRDGTFLLAQLYARMGDADRALELCGPLLARPSPDVVQFAADLYVSLGRSAEADALIARLDASNSRPGDRELVRARNLLRRGSPDAARDAYRAAADAAPARADIWTEFLSRAVGAGDVDVVTSILDDPRAADAEAVKFAKGARALYASSVADPRLRESLIAMLDDKAARPALTEALNAVLAGGADPLNRRDTARAVRRLAESDVAVLPLQLLSARLCAASGDVVKAAEIAGRAMTQFPNSVAAARLAAELFSAARRWPEALDAALAWHDRAGPAEVDSEIYVAGAQIQAGRAADAATRLAPRIPAARERPADNERMILLYALALVRSDRAAEAKRLLADLAAKSDAWRTSPLSLGPEWMGDAKSATTWLSIIAENVRESDAAGRLRLARGRAAAWEAFRDPSLLAAAKSGFDALLASPDCPAEAQFAAALLAEQTGDVEGAKRGYRAALQRAPSFAEAHNNLALLLAGGGEWQAAVAEATAATKAAPDNANYLDTLAFALRKGRVFDRAKSSLDAAIRLEPSNPAWRLSMAEALIESDDVAGATRAVAVVDELQTGGQELSAGDRDRLAKVRTAIRK